MNIVGYGGGTNSTAMLIGLYHRKIPVDLILFSNTGREQPHTYDFLPIMDRWLEEHGLPTITQVEYTDRNGDRLTLEQECLRSGTLPAIAYGYKKCSLKHKIQPQDKFCNNYPPCREVWARGERVVKFIGFDIGEQKRRDHAQPIDDADTKYKKEYPLMDWGWTREDCVTAIQQEGLPLPGKSSCFFLPQHETAGDFGVERAVPRPLPAGRRYGGQGDALPYQRQGAGPQLRLAGAVRGGGWRSKAMLMPVPHKKSKRSFDYGEQT